MKYDVKRYFLHFIVAVAVLAMAGCGRSRQKPEAEENVLVTVNDSSLLLDDVVRRIPSGISSEDSAELFSQMVDRWVESMIMEDVARENIIDIDRINRLAEDYRNRLIIDQYIRSMEENGRREVSDKEIRDYYVRHDDELVLKAPLVKGIYIKTSEKDDQLGNLRRWMAEATNDAADNIEKYGIRQASQYEYFMDQWVDWNAVAEQIPYRFSNADSFLASNHDFETSYGGSVYLLHISEFIPSGEKMPFDFASKIIAGVLSDRNSLKYRDNLKRSLYVKAVREGKMKSGMYDAIRGSMKQKAEVKEKK